MILIAAAEGELVRGLVLLVRAAGAAQHGLAALERAIHVTGRGHAPVLVGVARPDAAVRRDGVLVVQADERRRDAAQHRLGRATVARVARAAGAVEVVAVAAVGDLVRAARGADRIHALLARAAFGAALAAVVVVGREVVLAAVRLVLVAVAIARADASVVAAHARSAL